MNLFKFRNKRTDGRVKLKHRNLNPAALIVKHHKLINKTFVILFALSVLFYFFVGINYDLSEYLPEQARSKTGLNIMENEFGYPGSARIMLDDVSLYEAKLYKDKIAAVDGVDMVMWADLFTDVYQSSAFIDYDGISDYYKDGSACMDIIFLEGDSSKLTHKALNEIKAIGADKIYMGGPAVQNKSLGETLNREMLIAMSFAVVMIAIILCVTTTSWFEPVMFLTVMAVAIVLNMGSNIFLGEISFLTHSIAAVLQLAIAMDYSIFMLHTFTAEIESGLDKKQAMVSAIKKSSSSILASGITTIVGFIVLTLMSFKIGMDIGIVLAKGVVISLLTVILFMPSLIMKWYDIINKTRHKSFMPPFKRLSNFIYKYKLIPLIAVAVVIIPCYVGQSMSDFTYGSDSVSGSPGTEVYDAEQTMNAKFGRSNLLLLIVPNDSIVTERNLYNELKDLESVRSVISLGGLMPEGIPVSIIPKSVTSMLHTDNYVRMLTTLKTASESDAAFSAVEEIENIMYKHYPENSYLVGTTPSTRDIKDVIVDDYNRVNILSLLGVALVIAFTFKSALLPVIVMVPIEAAIFISMTMGYISGAKIMYVGYIVVSCLQLGATIDYSILMTEKYINARASMNKTDACREAVRGSALSILTSGSILAIVGYGLYFFSSVEAIGGMGRMVGRGALCSLVLVLGMLPPLLYYTDRLFIKSEKHPGFKHMISNLAYRGGRFLTRTHEDIKSLMVKLKTGKGDDNDENKD